LQEHDMSADTTQAQPDPPNLSPVQSEMIPTWRAAYSDHTSALMARFCWFAHLLFEPTRHVPGSGAPDIQAPGGRKKLEACLETGGFRLIDVFNKDRSFLAVRNGHFAVLAFRGTESGEWGINLNLWPVPLPGVRGVTVHRGFLGVFEQCRREIELAVNSNVPSTLRLYITGHSMGGALAQIASAVLDRDNLAACYTFGSPRVATGAFDHEVKCPHYRVINNWDLIPAVPIPWLLGYRHTGDPRLLTPGTLWAIRRDRYASFFMDIMALVVVQVLSLRVLITDDHMIWNYHTRLEEIAAARARPPSDR
jgi:triacylglycerol lipase